MKTPKMFIPEKNSEPKIEQLLEVPKLPQPEERYKTEIERITRKGYGLYDFLLTDSEILKVLEKLPARDVEGLEKVIITMPLRNEHYRLFGRYEKLNKISEGHRLGRIYLFKHLKTDGEFIIEQGYKTVKYKPEEFKIKNYRSLLHEAGHHVGIKDFDDDSEEFANDYMIKKYREIRDYI
ncbi:MAG: hypothetical protein Q8N77_01575 [Nanoarchaeota archaeon]|nr:hypothetical protein [Nanoarchaeota archaeon]